jgi:hypothetical protein
MTLVIGDATVAESMTVVIGCGYDGGQTTGDSTRRRIDEARWHDIVTMHGDAHSIR